MAALYVADQLSHPSPPVPPIGYGKIHRVTSAPASDLGNDGDAAIDMNTGAVYEKHNGAWAMISGGSPGTQVLQDYAPGTPPPNPTMPAVSFPTGGGTLSQWDVPSQTWV